MTADTPAKPSTVTVVESEQRPFGQIVMAGHHVLGADEPERFGGHDTGLSPYELLLAALGACTSMTIRMYADRHQWKLHRVSIALRHARATGSAGAADRFERIISLQGELSAEQRVRLVEIAEKCPVSQTLGRASRVETMLDQDGAPLSASRSTT